MCSLARSHQHDEHDSLPTPPSSRTHKRGWECAPMRRYGTCLVVSAARVSVGLAGAQRLRCGLRAVGIPVRERHGAHSGKHVRRGPRVCMLSCTPTEERQGVRVSACVHVGDRFSVLRQPESDQVLTIDPQQEKPRTHGHPGTRRVGGLPHNDQRSTRTCMIRQHRYSALAQSSDCSVGERNTWRRSTCPAVACTCTSTNSCSSPRVPSGAPDPAVSAAVATSLGSV